ncbi:MAG: hypothetical protein K8E66_04815 [Phycisphaerales bacterium]|nr:hypothetical protein [Phycisphaerales bacterium]
MPVAAAEPATGESTALAAPYVNTPTMNIMLKMASEDLGPDDHAVIIIDRADAGYDARIDDVTDAWRSLTNKRLRSVCQTPDMITRAE